MGKMCKWNRFVLFLVVLAFFGFSQAVSSQTCPPDADLQPLFTGPKNPVNGFPLWFMDQTGLALQICLDDVNGGCFFDPPDANNPFSVQVGFGPEAFWWLAGATMAVPGGDATLDMAAEAAWGAEVPNPGAQFPFTRLRIRIDTPQGNPDYQDSVFTVTHPYGVDVFTVATPGVRAINETIDIPLAPPTFGVSHVSRIGNFLYWDTLGQTTGAPPVGFIGDGATPHAVLGSPCDTNFFRIDAVTSGGASIDLDPGSINTYAQTTLFTVQGQIFTGGTPAIVDSNTYSRNASGQIDVFARALEGANILVDGNGPMVENTLGGILKKYFIHIPGLDAATLFVSPDTIIVAAAPPAANPFGYGTNNIEATLVDIVTITRAVYDVTTGGLTVVASSSDKFLPPTLTAEGLGGLTNGTATFALGPIPPNMVTVNSSQGGSATAKVIVSSNLAGVCEGDLDGDGDQDGFDLDIFSLDYGRGDCSPIIP